MPLRTATMTSQPLHPALRTAYYPRGAAFNPYRETRLVSKGAKKGQVFLHFKIKTNSFEAQSNYYVFENVSIV